MRSGASLLSVSVFASDLTELSGESRLRPVTMTGPQRPRYSAGGVSEMGQKSGASGQFFGLGMIGLPRAKWYAECLRHALRRIRVAARGLVLISPED